MPRKNDAWGIEVGANAIKAVRLVRMGSEAVIKDFEVLPFKQILTTPDINADEAIQVGLDTLLSKHDIGSSHVVVSIPGHMGFARFAKLPPVEPKKIPDIVRFEAVQQIPFPIEQVEWDYQVFQQADSPDVEVGIFAVTKERVLNYLANFRQVNLRVDGLTQSPLAVYNAFNYDRAELGDEGVIYMDIGTRSTDVIIAEQGQILPRTLPIGGNHFTEALVKAFKLSFPKAEKLKREAGTSKYARQIFQAMRPIFADLVQELQRSLGYYQSINREANLTKLVGVGSTFRLPGLQKFLKQQLQIEVIRPDGFERIAAEGKREAEFTQHALNMATAYGLALQGLGLESVSANLLPRHVLTQRMWRAKQPWFAASAACVAVAAGVMTASYFTTQGPYQSQLAESDAQLRRVLNQAQSNERAWNEVASGADPRQQIENLRQMIDYRDVWPKLMEDLSLAAAAVDPQPETVAADYDAMRRINRNERRRVYINTVDARYVTEGGVHSGQTAATRPTGRMGMTGRAGGAGGGGGDLLREFSVGDFFESGQPPRFVITVRGTTPHRDGAAFVNDEFIQWLRDNAERNDRPYRLVIPSEPIVSIDRISGASTERDSGTRATAQRGGRDSTDLASLLPTRPLAEEGQAGDWRFELRWEVELLPPAEARQERRPDAEPEDDDPSDDDLFQVRESDETASPGRARADQETARGEEAQS